MKKFSIIQEAQNRLYGGGNPFSNGHRSKTSGGYLENRHHLIDLDTIIYDDESIKVIVEKKFKAESKMGNILTDSQHFQRKMLLNVANKLNCKLFINTNSDDRYFRVSETEIKEFSKQSFLDAEQQYKTYNSDDVVYIEFRSNSPAAIIKRLADNINVDGLLYKMSELLNVPIFRVNDDNGTGMIHFYTFDKKLIGSVLNSTDESKRSQIENQWKEVYQKMNLW